MASKKSPLQSIRICGIINVDLRFQESEARTFLMNVLTVFGLDSSVPRSMPAAARTMLERIAHKQDLLRAVSALASAEDLTNIVNTVLFTEPVTESDHLEELASVLEYRDFDRRTQTIIERLTPFVLELLKEAETKVPAIRNLEEREALERQQKVRRTAEPHVAALRKLGYKVTPPKSLAPKGAK